jgi:transposase InsO family protein
VVTPRQQRAAADYLVASYGISQRRASQVLDRARSTLRYHGRSRSQDEPLIRVIRRLARQHLRFGYKRIHARLVHQGWKVNRKRVRRLWNELGLRRPSRRQKPKKGGSWPGSSANSCVKQPAGFKNDVWTYDFIVDRTVDGRSLKWLSLVDEYTRECLALVVAESITGSDVRRVLARVIGRRGTPTRIRSDNGSEFICAAVRDWLPEAGAKPIPVAPASPWENGFIESFHSRLRDEFLDREEFDSVADARAKAKWWRREYNRIRPHSGIGYKTPQMFSEECDRGLHGQRPKQEVFHISPSIDWTPISGGPKNG